MGLDVIQPRQCPELRSDMLAFLRAEGACGAARMLSWLADPSSNEAEMTALEFYGPQKASVEAAKVAASRMATSAEVAELFIIAKHKMKDVLEGADVLETNMDVQRHWFHADHGIMFFEKPWYSRAFSSDAEFQYETPIAAISWSITGQFVRITSWADTSRFLSLASKDIPRDYDRPPIPMKDIRAVQAQVGPLIVCASFIVQLRSYMQELRSDDFPRHPLRVLLSGCLMMRQEVTARSVVEAPRSSWRRMNQVSPHLGKTVTVIDKRSIKRNPTNEVEPEVGARQLSVRYDRRGHWREYKHERFSPEMREHPIWIPAHWVGHEGLPLATRSKVTRLTR